jgi:hypothetical protein
MRRHWLARSLDERRNVEPGEQGEVRCWGAAGIERLVRGQLPPVRSDTRQDRPAPAGAPHHGVYAAHVHAGELPGPYSDEAAEMFARTLLVAEDELERTDDDQKLAGRLGIPLEQAQLARAEAPRTQMPDRPRLFPSNPVFSRRRAQGSGPPLSGRALPGLPFFVVPGRWRPWCR